MEARLNNIAINIVHGDPFSLNADALVISASPDLRLNPLSDLERRVLELGGTHIEQEAAAQSPCDEGRAILTTAGQLPFQSIIHAVGPTMGSGSERGKLASAVWNALNLAVDHQLKSLIFTAISTGRFGYPVESCASVMAQKIVDFTFEDITPLSTIILCLDTPQAQSLFTAAFRREIDSARDEASTSG
jgi:O-acetyl-ADP-ribose deacetylase